MKTDIAPPASCQPSLNRSVDITFPPSTNTPANGFPPAIGFAEPFETPPVSSIPIEHAIAAARAGRKMIRRMRAAWRPVTSKHAQAEPAKIVKPRRPLIRSRARAPHSHTAHGGAREGDSGGDPSPSRKRKRTIKPVLSSRIFGWAKFGRFRSDIGRKINPGKRAYFKDQSLGVTVAGPRHDQQSGKRIAVRSVSGKITQVILKRVRETHPDLPITLYGWSYDREAVGKANR